MKSEVCSGNGSMATGLESADAGDIEPAAQSKQVDIETLIEAALQEEIIRQLKQAALQYEAEEFGFR